MSSLTASTMSPEKPRALASTTASFFNLNSPPPLKSTASPFEAIAKGQKAWLPPLLSHAPTTNLQFRVIAKIANRPCSPFTNHANTHNHLLFKKISSPLGKILVRLQWIPDVCKIPANKRVDFLPKIVSKKTPPKF